jgi:hypothetical protein
LSRAELFQTAIPSQWTMSQRAISTISRFFELAQRLPQPAADESFWVGLYESRMREP